MLVAAKIELAQHNVSKIARNVMRKSKDVPFPFFFALPLNKRIIKVFIRMPSDPLKIL